jgi:hypothetical protein
MASQSDNEDQDIEIMDLESPRRRESENTTSGRCFVLTCQQKAEKYFTDIPVGFCSSIAALLQACC